MPKKSYNFNSWKQIPWEDLHGQFVDGRFVYYDFIEDEDGEWLLDQKYSFRFTEEKFHQYTSLIVKPGIIDLLVNETRLSDQDLKKYISEVFFKEENDLVREQQNKKARARRLKQKN